MTLSLDRALADSLRRAHVRIDVTDRHTAWLRDVPANTQFFNKPSTNVLVKRPGAGLPFVVCVDEDLQYRGADGAVARAFAQGPREHGWRVLFAGSNGELQPVVERALDALGFDGCEPSLKPGEPSAKRAAGARLIDSFGEDLTAAVDDGSAEPCVERSVEVEELCRGLLQARPVMPIVAGVSGIGKTNLLHGAARRLRACRPGLRLVRVDLGVVLAGTLFEAERENLLASLVKEAVDAGTTVLALEHFEVLQMDSPCGPLVVAGAIDAGARLIGTTPALFAPYVARLRAPLGRRLAPIDLLELPLARMPSVLAPHVPSIARHHGVGIPESFLDAVIDAACAMEGALPAKALSLVDAAASAAALAGRDVVTLVDLHALVHRPERRS